jgi:hypothetical protein
MKLFLTILLATLCAATSYGQTIKALSYNTSNNAVVQPSVVSLFDFGAVGLRANRAEFGSGSGAVGFSTNGRLTFYTTNSGMNFSAGASAAQLRNDLQLGQSNAVTFAQLYIQATNVGAFEGLANIIASNNTTVSNETLFRVGVAEATNKAAQFGFRSTNTNGSGVAVFSVFGYNALMMIGADASTNAVVYSGGGTNNEVMTLIKSGATEFARPISFSTTAHAAATRTNLSLGATSDPTFRDLSVRDLSIVGGSGGKIIYPQTNTAPADTTNAVTWIQVNVGTNSYRVPLYQ